MVNPIRIYKTVEEAYNALLKGFRSIEKREPNAIENQMIKAEAEVKIKSQGDNISILPQDKQEGIKSLEPGTKKPDLDRPFVTDEEMSAFTLEDNARKLNKAKGFIDKLGAKTSRQKLFVADLVEDAGEGIFKNVDMGAVVRSNMFDDLIEQGIDDDLLTKIMYSDTKSNNFATTLAKIKSNVADESIDIAPGTGVDVNETIDFYGRVFDEVSRVKKSMGGRIGYAVGTGIKLAKFFKDKGTTLAAEIRKAVDNIFASGDSKYDADVAVDSALEEFGVDREMFDQMDIIDAYDEAYQTIVKQKGLVSKKVPGGTQVFKDSEGGIKGISMGGDKKFKDAMSEAMEEGMRESENMKRLGLDPSKMKDALKYDEMKEAGQLEKNVTGSADLSPVEDLKREFPGITDEMIENILSDNNPQRIAEVKQTMREAMAMEQKGMSADEIISTFKNTKRTKNAKGGRIGLDRGGTAIQRLRQDLVDNMAKYAPGIPESKLQEIVKDINFDMSSEEVQKTVRTGLINLFGMATGGRVQAASGGLARILNL